MAVKKEVSEARKKLCKEQGKTVDANIINNGSDEAFNDAFNAALADAPVKERRPREVKIKHAKGSPHEILHTLVDTLSPTQADYLHRHIIKKALKDEHATPDSFEGELYTGLRSKVVTA